MKGRESDKDRSITTAVAFTDCTASRPCGNQPWHNQRTAVAPQVHDDDALAPWAQKIPRTSATRTPNRGVAAHFTAQHGHYNSHCGPADRAAIAFAVEGLINMIGIEDLIDLQDDVGCAPKKAEYGVQG
eukprot:CAMPEP_0174306860 /NCGR_PEP_ID=MMETSP0810-20121108/732_1 /TAXON_ID=73025 ORGANISM="Eutreptiella gymnastica-like, Strain CCMP1594" /NCGR_SAMPLE_ID=MMETSP0810 /ASSEMBLY_ACC=CAM_ASM_000659 /LENGTH=128 /DNA_ID=CAMNT_0015413715 /DNA_START=893 /DNA_END=1281 /DNA_ORIENTATION=-